MKSRVQQNSGIALIEALVSILLFSIGALGLLGLQAAATKNSTDAAYRSDAAYLTNQIIGHMWVDRANLDLYSHLETGSVCTFTGSASSNTKVTTWIADAVTLLPAVTSERAQIQVTTPTPDTRQIKVTVCWQSPQDAGFHNFTATAVINQ